MIRFRRGNAEKTLAQDGFSAAVEEDVPTVSPRPWHDETGPIPVIAIPTQSERAAQAPDAAPAGGIAALAWTPPVQPARPAPTATPYAMVGRRVIDFADNGDGTLSVARCIDKNVDDLDIQFEAGACPVVSIAPKAFEGCTALRRVALPKGLRQIGEMAFSGCVRLSQLEIPGSVQRVGTLAFAKCASLARVRIEPGVQALGPSCFSKCTGLERVDVPASLAAFGGGAFFGCGRQLCLYGAADAPAAEYAKMNGIRYDSESWREDAELILDEQEDGTLVVMGPRQERPARIEIPSEICGRRIVGVAERAFFANYTLSAVSIGAGVKEIGEKAFFGCPYLTSVTLERGLERVGECAFAGCENLTQITLPWGMQAVGRMAFFGCKRLSFVKMPATTRVAPLAFDGCAQGLRVFGGVSAERI